MKLIILITLFMSSYAFSWTKIRKHKETKKYKATIYSITDYDIKCHAIVGIGDANINCKGQYKKDISYYSADKNIELSHRPGRSSSTVNLFRTLVDDQVCYIIQGFTAKSISCVGKATPVPPHQHEVPEHEHEE